MTDRTKALREHMASYVPRFVRKRAARHLGGDSLFWCEAVDGTLVFADVSGFTAMSERLARGGKVGAEELTRILNAYFETMIATLEGYGGDVVKFGGDAMLLMFAEGSAEECARRALAAAAEMQRRMDEEFAVIRTSQGEFPLKMSIGAASGPMTATSLGTQKGAEFFVFGPVVNQVAAVETVAQATEVCSDAETLRRAGLPEERCEACGDGIYRLPQREIAGLPVAAASAEEAPDTQALHPYVFPALAKRFEAAASAGKEPSMAAESEHRKVTTAFLLAEGLHGRMEALGREEAMREFDAFVCRVYEKTLRAGGTVAKVDLYPKGYKLMLFFGAPQAHENDEERALLALRDIMQDGGPYHLHAGTNTGFVFAGEVGARSRREYTVMGDAVNLAARLMTQAGEGEILFGEETRRLAGAAFRYTALPPVRVKGKSDPVPLFRLDDLAESSGGEGEPRVPFAGRKEQRQAFGEFLKKIREGGGPPAFLLQGGAGMGKTHLLQTLIPKARREGWQVFFTQARAQTAVVPYRPWRHVLRGLLNVERNATFHHLETRLAGAFHGMTELESAAPLLAEMLGAEVPPDRNSTLEPQERQRLLQLAMYAVMRERVRQGPVLVVMDAMELADAPSRLLWKALVSFASMEIPPLPLAFAATSRHEEGDVSDAVRAKLEPLPPRELGEVLSAHRAGAQVPEPLAEFLSGRTQGNPYFALQVLEVLEKRGAVSWEHELGELLVRRDLSEEAVPDTLQGLMLGRVDALGEAERNLLKMAAVLGPEWSEALLVRMASIPAEELPIDALRREGVILPHPGGRWAFEPALLQEVLYESLPYLRRREWHLQAAEVIEKNPEAVEFSARDGTLAHHFFRAEAWPRALPYLERSAEAARSRFSNHQALQLFQQALAAAEKSAAAAALMARFRLAVGRLQYQLGNLDGAMAEAEAMGSLLATEFEGELAAEMHSLKGAVLRSRGKLEESLSEMEKAGQHASETGRWKLVARIHTAMAETFGMKGEMARSAQYMDMAGEILERYPDAFLQATLEFNRGTWLLLQERIADAQKIVEKVLAEARRQRWITLEGSALNNLAYAAFCMGNMPEATRRSEEALLYFEKFHLMKEILYQTATLSGCYLNMAEYEAAAKAASKCLLLAKRAGFQANETFALNALIDVRTSEGKFAEALEADRELSVRLSENRIPASELGYYHLCAAELYLTLACVPHARNHLEAMRRQMEEKPDGYFGDLFLLSARLAMLEGRWDAAREHCLRFKTLEEERTQPSSRLQWLLVNGRVFLHAGSFNEAKELFHAALRQAEAAGMLRCYMEALLALAEHPEEKRSIRAREALAFVEAHPSREAGARAHAALADALLAEGKPREAARTFATALEIFDGMALALPGDIKTSFMSRPDYARTRQWMEAFRRERTPA